jgi:hypothetical protein
LGVPTSRGEELATPTEPFLPGTMQSLSHSAMTAAAEAIALQRL